MKEETTTPGEFELVPDFSSTVNLLRSIHSGYAQFSGKSGQVSYGAGLRMEYMDRGAGTEGQSRDHRYDVFL